LTAIQNSELSQPIIAVPKLRLIWFLLKLRFFFRLFVPTYLLLLKAIHHLTLRIVHRFALVLKLQEEETAMKADLVKAGKTSLVPPMMAAEPFKPSTKKSKKASKPKPKPQLIPLAYISAPCVEVTQVIEAHSCFDPLETVERGVSHEATQSQGATDPICVEVTEDMPVPPTVSCIEAPCSDIEDKKADCAASVMHDDLPDCSTIILLNMEARNQFFRKYKSSAEVEELMMILRQADCEFTVLRPLAEEMRELCEAQCFLPLYGQRESFWAAVQEQSEDEEDALYKSANLLQAAGKEVIVVAEGLHKSTLSCFDTPVITFADCCDTIQRWTDAIASHDP